MAKTSGARIAIDIGGTFTDVAVGTADGYVTAKTLTTPAEPVTGVLDGIALALERAALTPADVACIIHGTTLATNALIERRGARVAVITTEGFRDTLEIAYERRYDQYDVFLDKPDAYVPRERCFTVPERIDADGRVHRPLDEAAFDGLIEALDASGAESVAVCLLHSYANPAHEQRIGAMLRQRRPDLSLSLSSEVCPEIREYDRLCTTVANAYVRPLMARYLIDLERGLIAAGLDCALYIMTSGGGMTTVATAVRFPIRMVESGPSGGAVLAAKLARRHGLDRVVSFDMGGTTAKVCLIDDGQPQTSRRFEIARAARFIKGSGLPVLIPAIDMIEIGAGGGSVASVDGLGRLAIGPESAGAEPGPSCYARGGVKATVTDADATAGLLDPDAFAEGRLKLNLDLARDALARDVSAAMSLTVEDAAYGVAEIVDENMANAARVHAVEDGKELADRTMIAFGGNGPLHAARVAEKTGVARIIVPPDPGVGSAVGFLAAPITYEIVRSHYTLAENFDFAGVNATLAEMEREASDVVRLGALEAPFVVARTAFMRYRGQGHEIEVAAPDGALDADALARLCAGYDETYARLFGRAVPGMVIEIVNWRVTVTAQAVDDDVAPSAARVDDGEATPVGHRRVWLGALGAHAEVPCYRRADLAPSQRIDGPALIVEPQTTTYVAGSLVAEIDDAMNIVMTRRDEVARPAATVKATSAIDRQAMWNRLLAVVEEQAQALMRTAFSPIVRECGDISAGIFDTRGRMLAQAVTGTPGHINTMAEACGKMIGVFPVADMQPGDVYLTNDPWLAAGHLNDLLLVAPVFHDGRAVGLVSCTSHVYDIGGRGPTTDGADIFEEGIRLPPVRIVAAGTVDRYLIDLVKANSRTPVPNEGDIYALIACCDVGAARTSEMMGEYGLGDLEEVAEYILTTSRDGVIDAIRQIPNGVYDNVMRLDGYDFEIDIAARMTVGDETIEIDFDGTSSCSRFGINVPLNYATAYSVFGIRCIVGPDIPNNAGSLEPFHVTAPAGCIVNAMDPAPVAMRHMIGQTLPDVMFGCLHQALPGRVPAEGTACLWNLPLRSAASVAVNGNATVFSTDPMHNGGTGARPTKDGLSATAYPSGVWGSQVELAESTDPIRYLRRELRPDSGGPGRHRGGMGQSIEIENREGAPMLHPASVERMKFPARGRAGGADGRLGTLRLGSGKQLGGKGIHEISAGDKLVVETPGGGGYGPSREREPDRVEADVRAGLISRAAAQRDYGVVLDEALTVDAEATARRRAAMAARD